MGFLSRLFARPLAPSTTSRRIDAHRGATTAQRALAVALPEARTLDPDARLLLVTSGTDIRPDGRSLTWELLFELPARSARLLASLEPAPEAADPDTAAFVLTLRVTRSTELSSGRELPLVFRDSPDAVAALTAVGVDFVAGPTDLKLEARVHAGRPSWLACTRSGERAVPFGGD